MSKLSQQSSLKILIHGRHFPVAMFRFFHWAFEDLGHEVFTVGPYSGGTIPWGNFFYPNHTFPPDYILPDTTISLHQVLSKIDFKPDMILQAGDTSYLDGLASVPNCILMTDPHVVNYLPRFMSATHVFNMQNFYMTRNQHWIPYAYYPGIHKRIESKKSIEFDVVFSGLQYEHRVKALEKMRENGLRVFSSLGLIYENYVDAYNQGLIAFNWSSKEDLPARFWEGLAMGRMVLTNRVPDLTELEFKEGVDYVGFSTLEEAVDKAKYYAKHTKEALEIAANGFKKVQPHTYQKRCEKILEVVNG